MCIRDRWPRALLAAGHLHGITRARPVGGGLCAIVCPETAARIARWTHVPPAMALVSHPDKHLPRTLLAGLAGKSRCGRHAAVGARAPMAVDRGLRSQRSLPIAQHELLRHTAAEVLPGQGLVDRDVALGIPDWIETLVGECRPPNLKVEVIVPGIESSALLPCPTDDPAQSPVASPERSFQDRTLRVVPRHRQAAAVHRLAQGRYFGLYLERAGLAVPLERRHD